MKTKHTLLRLINSHHHIILFYVMIKKHLFVCVLQGSLVNFLRSRGRTLINTTQLLCFAL